MKQFLWLAIGLLGINNLFAQEGERLTVPSSPAFTILNFEPAAVMKPTSTKELTTNILSAFDADGKLVPNLGLEVTPYWLKRQVALTRRSFLYPSAGQAFRQSFSLSAATVYDSVARASKLGFGFRFNLKNGKPTQEFLDLDSIFWLKKNSLTTIVAVARAQAGTAFSTPKDAMAFIEANAAGANLNAEDVDTLKVLAMKLINTNAYDSTRPGMVKFLEDLIAAYQAHLLPMAARLSELTYERTGFFLEFAGGSGFNAKNNKALGRLGLWSNASYYLSPEDLLSFTARYLYQNSGGALDSIQHNMDIGFSFLKKRRLFNFSLEALLRWYRAEMPTATATATEQKATYRLAFQSAYNLAPNISINISLGKDFDSPFLKGNGFFSILGFSYNIFSIKPKEIIGQPRPQ